MSSKYVSPTGIRISPSEYHELAAQSPNPYVLRKFQNEKISMSLIRIGVIHRVEVVPIEHQMNFKVEIWNITELGLVEDLDSAEFRTEPQATAYFEKFLAKWTECVFDPETGKLKEVGNIFTPPDPDIPVVAEHTFAAGEFGTW